MKTPKKTFKKAAKKTFEKLKKTVKRASKKHIGAKAVRLSQFNTKN